MDFSYNFYNIHNTKICPEQSCFLPRGIGQAVRFLKWSDDGLFTNVSVREVDGKQIYSIQIANKVIVTSDSKEEIMEIRNCILNKQLSDLAYKYRGLVPESIYNRLLDGDWLGENQ